MIGPLPDGTPGFDCNAKVPLSLAKRFYDHGYRFAVRYVRRDLAHHYDISAPEIVDLLKAGLGVMLVQHVAPPGWHPAKALGSAYGAIAADHAAEVGYPRGCTLWCDLEGVDPRTTPLDVIQFCNAWYEKVQAAGFVPGLYVGDSCRLSAIQLYRDLKFKAYWSAYNLNADNVPAKRGVQMKQKAYPHPGSRVPGVPFEYDVDIIRSDALGGSPVLCLPLFDL